MNRLVLLIPIKIVIGLFMFAISIPQVIVGIVIILGDVTIGEKIIDSAPIYKWWDWCDKG